MFSSVKKIKWKFSTDEVKIVSYLMFEKFKATVLESLVRVFYQ